MDLGTSAIIIVLFILIIWYISQTKFKNKMLCTFRRPNKQKIKKWVPLFNKTVVFDRGKYGIDRYLCNPKAITLEWYTAGINKFFPVLIPTLDFRWDTPFPLDPETFEPTWLSPEAFEAAWQEHQHVAFAKSAASQTGKKSRFPEWLFPLVIVAAIAMLGFFMYSTLGGMDKRLFNIENSSKFAPNGTQQTELLK